MRARVVAPARTLRTSWPGRRCGRMSRPTRPSIWGLIARITTSAPSTASPLAATARIPWTATSCSRRSARGWLATICDGSTRWPRSTPAMIASAMTPEPTVAIVRCARGDMGRVCHAAEAGSGCREPSRTRCRRAAGGLGPAGGSAARPRSSSAARRRNRRNSLSPARPTHSGQSWAQPSRSVRSRVSWCVPHQRQSKAARKDTISGGARRPGQAGLRASIAARAAARSVYQVASIWM